MTPPKVGPKPPPRPGLEGPVNRHPPTPPKKSDASLPAIGEAGKRMADLGINAAQAWLGTPLKGAAQLFGNAKDALGKAGKVLGEAASEFLKATPDVNSSRDIKISFSKQFFPQDQKILKELKTALQYIMNHQKLFDYPRFSSEDFFHGHIIQAKTRFGFLFHTKENLPKPDPVSKRNIIFWFGSSGPTTVSPKKGKTVTPLELGARERKHLFFSNTKESLDKVLKNSLQEKSKYSLYSLKITQNRRSSTIWVAILSSRL
jgi:hypothetical protein